MVFVNSLHSCYEYVFVLSDFSSLGSGAKPETTNGEINLVLRSVKLTRNSLSLTAIRVFYY